MSGGVGGEGQDKPVLPYPDFWGEICRAGSPIFPIKCLYRRKMGPQLLSLIPRNVKHFLENKESSNGENPVLPHKPTVYLGLIPHKFIICVGPQPIIPPENRRSFVIIEQPWAFEHEVALRVILAVEK